MATTIRVRHRTIGPALDPYAVDDVVVERDGHRYVFSGCGLRGFAYYRDDERVVDWNANWGIPAAAFATDTGATLAQWERWLGRLDARRAAAFPSYGSDPYYGHA